MSKVIGCEQAGESYCMDCSKVLPKPPCQTGGDCTKVNPETCIGKVTLILSDERYGTNYCKTCGKKLS